MGTSWLSEYEWTSSTLIWTPGKKEKCYQSPVMELPVCSFYIKQVQLLIIHGVSLTLVERVLLKTFQKRRVSSPAPVTMASPSGDIAYK